MRERGGAARGVVASHMCCRRSNDASARLTSTAACASPVTQEAQSFLADLSQWTSDVKRKDEALRSGAGGGGASPLPPPRAAPVRGAAAPLAGEAAASTPPTPPSQAHRHAACCCTLATAAAAVH
jgi:hypothetical protein